MAPSGKPVEGRRKSGGKPSLLVTLAVPSSRLRQIFTSDSVKDGLPSTKDVPVPKDLKDSPANSAAPNNSNGENASDSNAATPAAESTPAPSAMGPPVEGPKKKGTKRSAVGANGATDASSKPRGKPGPKKKPRLYVRPFASLRVPARLSPGELCRFVHVKDQKTLTRTTGKTEQ